MKNVHILPTDKPSRIYLNQSNSKLGITSDNPYFTKNYGVGFQNQNIYITSDEEIKEGDWFLYQEKLLVKHDGSMSTILDCKKIILTTNVDLIQDGVQAIDDQFLEWFVKNPSCVRVEVRLEIGTLRWSDSKNTYKIIIPKEEPKQETLEQTAVEWLVDKMLYIENEYDMKLITKGEYQAKRRDIIDQAKEMEQVQDTKRLLFHYKVSLIIGLKKAGKLLKEVDKEIKQ